MNAALETSPTTGVRVIESKPWQVELYDNEVLPVHALSEEDLAAEQRDYTALGLLSLAERAAQMRRGSARRGCAPLSQHELDVWAWRYPTVYRIPSWARGSAPWEANASQRFPQLYEAWAQLEWPMPPEVRALAIAMAPKYDWLEIWVPELRRAPQIGISPILVGACGGHYELLARWAEALEPFEDIERRMESKTGKRAMRIRRLYQRGATVDDAALQLLGAIAFTVFTLVALGTALTTAENPVGVSVFAATFVIPTAYLWRAVYLHSTSAVKWACKYAGWVIR